MVNRYMKRYSISLIVRAMRMKTIMRYQLTSFKMDVIKKTEINSVGEDTEERKHLYAASGNVKCCSHFGKQYRSTSKNF